MHPLPRTLDHLHHPIHSLPSARSHLDRPCRTLDRWSFVVRVAEPFPKPVTAAGSFTLALFACCSSHCTSRPHTTSYPSSGASLPTWYALPAKQPCYPNPPPLSHLPKLSLSPLKPVQASCHAAYQQRNPCHPSSLPLPPLVRSVLSTLRSPALLSLVCPSHPINYTLPSCLFPDPAPRLPRCCCTSVATP